MKPSLFATDPKTLAAWLESVGEKPYRAKQILDWIYQKKQLKLEQMTNLNASVKAKLQEKFSFSSVEVVKQELSQDQETIKFLFRLPDGKLIESVLIMSDKRRTVCVSSQVGCPAKCAFCASGQKGWMRNLDAGEIIAQVLEIDAYLSTQAERVSHIVYMGMGEPLENYDAVVESIRLLCHPEMLNLSQRRITVSTVGVIEGILKLAKEAFKVNLVLSLHAPNQKIRKKIIPYARQYALEEILEAMDHYSLESKRDITYEYILISGINDQKEHAEELAVLLRGKQCAVNLIPYNPIPNLRLKRPDHETIKTFRSTLSAKGLVHTCRYTKGDDIAAACGQLALQEETESPLKMIS